MGYSMGMGSSGPFFGERGGVPDTVLQCNMACRLCNPFIVEFAYFFFCHVKQGLNRNVITLTGAEKWPVSLKPL